MTTIIIVFEELVDERTVSLFMLVDYGEKATFFDGLKERKEDYILATKLIY